MDNQPQQLSRKDEQLQAALIFWENLQQNEDLHRALAHHRAFLEEIKLEFNPNLDTTLVEFHARHAYMAGQLELITALQEILNPTQPQPDSE